MPGQAHNFLQVSPETLYLSPNSSGDLALGLSNVGNQAGSFPIVATTPLTAATITNLQSPVFLNPGQSDGQTPTPSIGPNAPHGRYPLVFSSPAPDSYTQYALAELFVLTQNAGAVAAAAACDLGVTALSASLQTLALAADDLEVSCESGVCAAAAKDRTLAALDSVIHYAALASSLLTVGPELQAIAADLAAHTTPADILADLYSLAAAAGQLGLELCELEEHQPDARLNPYLDAILLGDTAVLTLTVANQGSVATTYAVTVTTPTGDQTFSPAIGPGDTAVLPISTTPAALGSYDLVAEVVPTAPAVQMAITDTAVARLNVVGRFVQVTAVLPDPPFVETGVSSTTLSVEVANVAGIAQAVTAHAAIVAADGNVQWSEDVPLTLLIGNPRAYELATVNTSGWTVGVYTITVDLRDPAGSAVPDGYGYGYLGVGQALGASHAVAPALVAPGTVTVTTVMTTELLAETILPPTSTRPLVPWPLRPLLSGQAALTGDQPAAEQPDGGLPVADESTGGAGVAANSRPSLLTTWAITSTENTDAAVTYTGAWTLVNNVTADLASNGDYHWSQTAGDVASFSFSGPWIAVGLVADTDNGYAELFVDGVSQALVDLYSRQNDVRRVTIDGLADTAHVITVTVTGLQNPFSNNDRVEIDYLGYWEQKDETVR